MSLKGKVAIVSGAGTGVGKATTKRLFLEGSKVVLIGRDRSRLTKVISELNGNKIDIKCTLLSLWGNKGRSNNVYKNYCCGVRRIWNTMQLRCPVYYSQPYDRTVPTRQASQKNARVVLSVTEYWRSRGYFWCS